MRMRGFLCLAVAALLAACDGPTGPVSASQELFGSGAGLRVVANSDLSEPRFTNGGPNAILTATALDADGFRSVFVLDAITFRSAVVSRADTILDQATGFDIELQPNDRSRGGTPSQDGSYAAYLSKATNLLEARLTTFKRRHVYLRDLFGESNELISVGSAPQLGNESRILLPDTWPIPEANDDSTSAVISGDGRFVAYASRATNIVPLAKSGLSQIYVYDRDFRSIELITRVAIGEDVIPGDGTSIAPFITTTGRFVAYQSEATNLIAGDTNNGRDIFVFNRTERTTARLNIDLAGMGTLFDPGPPVISEDGNIVVFSAKESDGPLAVRHIYVRDRAAGTTTRLSENEDGVPGNKHSEAPALDENGRFVVFQSDATNLLPTLDTNGETTDIFVFDIWSLEIGGHSLRRVNVNKKGEQADRESIMPTISADGTLIAFVSRALNLIGPDGKTVRFVEHDDEIAIRGTPTAPQSQALDVYVFANSLLQ